MVLNANADVPSIGLNALGDYARSLHKTDRPVYYTGMINFIARYAAKESPKYPVARFIVTAQSQGERIAGAGIDRRVDLRILARACVTIAEQRHPDLPMPKLVDPFEAFARAEFFVHAGGGPPTTRTPGPVHTCVGLAVSDHKTVGGAFD
jgi:hypothetical protein